MWMGLESELKDVATQMAAGEAIKFLILKLFESAASITPYFR